MLLNDALDYANRYLESLPQRHVGARATREDLLRSLAVPLRDDGEPAEEVLASLVKGAEPGIIGSAGPRYFGFVIGGSIPATIAADWMTSAWDQNGGIFVTSPANSVCEEIAREWLLDLFDLPRTSGLGLVTGGQMANFTCLAAARHAVLRKLGWNVEENGLAGAPRVNIVAGAEAHITIYAALRYLGFGTKSVITVDADEQGRMRADALRKTLEHLNGATIVCAQAGNVNSGAVDPLREIAEVVREHGGWVHVDGAFGLWGRATTKRRALLDGADLADSWAVDGHKWLNVPYDNGIAIVRDAAAHRASMTTTAEYLQQTSGSERDPFDWTPEFSRRARGFTVYAALRHLGRGGVASMIDRACDRAAQFADLLGRHPHIQVMNEVVLNQVLVRFHDDDAKTRDVISRVQNEGTCWMGGTTWHGKAAMRISVSNWATTEEDVEKSVEAIARLL